MSDTAVITDPSKNNMDGTSEVPAHPPLTSIAGHFTGAERSHRKVAKAISPLEFGGPGRELYFYEIRFLRLFYYAVDYFEK